MTYRIYETQPLTSEMVRVMQDWFDGRDSMFFKVSIGATEEKRLHPTAKKHFKAICREAQTALREMTDEMAEKHPEDVEALQDLASWASRQSRIMDMRETLRDLVKDALKAGMTNSDILAYVDNVISAESSPVD